MNTKNLYIFLWNDLGIVYLFTKAKFSRKLLFVTPFRFVSFSLQQKSELFKVVVPAILFL